MPKKPKEEGGHIKGVYIYKIHEDIIDAVMEEDARLNLPHRKDSKILADALIVAYGHLLKKEKEETPDSNLDKLVAIYYQRKKNLPMDKEKAYQAQMAWINAHLEEFHRSIKYRNSTAISIYEDLEMSECKTEEVGTE